MFGRSTTKAVRALPFKSSTTNLPLITFRNYSGPPIKSYHGLKTPLSLIWANSPPQAKVFGGIVALGLAIAHLHPNTMITLGPPLGVGAWLLRRQYERSEYNKLIKGILPTSQEDFEKQSQRIRVARYDETDVDTVLEGFDNQFQYFQKQILEIVEKRIVDYIAVSETKSDTISKLLRPLVDENKQVTVHLGSDFETFVTTKAEVPAVSDDTFVEFTKLSVPYFNSKNTQKRTRLGVAEVSLLEIPLKEEQVQDFRIAITLVQYKQWGAAKEHIDVLPGQEIQKSLFCE